MARVTIHDVDDAPSGSKDTLEGLKEQMGGNVLNIHGAMAASPRALHFYTRTEELLASESTLDGKTREAIHLAVSGANSCTYCMSAYTMTSKQQGFDEDQTVEIRGGKASFDEKLETMLVLVREVAQNKGHVSDAAWKSAQDAGWSDEELLDGFADAMRAMYTNYFNHFTEVELDLPLAPGLEG